ncbi:MAG: hypothetical protein AVDCRST_MAG77-6040, partial [uncultured Chloroflexi bacterium]
AAGQRRDLLVHARGRLSCRDGDAHLGAPYAGRAERVPGVVGHHERFHHARHGL